MCDNLILQVKLAFNLTNVPENRHTYSGMLEMCVQYVNYESV